MIQPREGADLDLTVVAREVDEAVAELTASGRVDPATERELEALFWQYAPLSGRGTDRSRALHEAMRVVDATAYVDPLVPIASGMPGGSFAKKLLRKAYLWYIGWLTNQVSHHHVAVGRALHLVEEELAELRGALAVDGRERTAVVTPAELNAPEAWWVDAARALARGAGGRVLHLGCADGWLVAQLQAEGVDAYGVDPRLEQGLEAREGHLELRGDGPLRHLAACEPRSHGAVIVTGVAEGLEAPLRDQLVELLDRVAGSHGVLVVHSLTPEAWADPTLGAEADLAAGRPLRMESWEALAARHGRRAELLAGPSGRDYLVVLRADG